MQTCGIRTHVYTFNQFDYSPPLHITATWIKPRSYSNIKEDLSLYYVCVRINVITFKVGQALNFINTKIHRENFIVKN